MRHNPGPRERAMPKIVIDDAYLDQLFRVGRRARNSGALVFQTAVDAIADVRQTRQHAHGIIERSRKQTERDKLKEE